MANIRKRISELTPLTSASLDTTIVGIDNGITYKIELDVIADSVANRINILDIQRLNTLESVTSSFETKGRSIISSSTQITDFGFISNSVDITSLNNFTASISTASLVQRLNTLESVTSSFETKGRSIISSSTQITDFGFISNSVDITSLNNFTASISTASLVQRLNTIESITASYETKGSGILSGSISYLDLTNIPFNIISESTNLSQLNQFTQSIDGRVDTLETATSSYLTSLNGTISSSTQITNLGFVSGSYEITGRGIISGSVSYTSLVNIPSGIVSGSSQLSNVPIKVTGNWTLATGVNNVSFSVEQGHTYSMWVNGNVPNGIITWNAIVTISNSNVPAIGSQYAWYYVTGNALVFTSIPDQIIGTNGGIISSPNSYVPNTANVFKFGITNNSGTTQIVNYGYIRIS